MARRPRIAITMGFREEPLPAHELPDGYVRAVVAAGGLPWPVPSVEGDPLVEALLAEADGLLLTGGGDLDPAWYGQLPHPRLRRVTPRRDRLELTLTRAALQAGKPILAICRGVQVLNVAAGGTLVQDIESQVPGALQHDQTAPRDYPTHPVEVAAGTRLAALLGSGTVRVNSLHHQAVAGVAPGFVAAAHAPDGVIEAIELADPRRFAVGVQWHPEALWERDPRFLALFRALVEAAAG